MQKWFSLSQIYWLSTRDDADRNIRFVRFKEKWIKDTIIMHKEMDM